MSINPQSGPAGQYTPDNLHAGEFPVASVDGVILEGQNIERGAVLGRITASGKWRLSLSASDDGSQVPRAIALNAVDATEADKVGPIARTGDFNANAVILGAGHTVASVREGLADQNIYLRSTVSA